MNVKSKSYRSRQLILIAAQILLLYDLCMFLDVKLHLLDLKWITSKETLTLVRLHKNHEALLAILNVSIPACDIDKIDIIKDITRIDPIVALPMTTLVEHTLKASLI